MGDAVNLAARVMGKCPPRSVLATEDVIAGANTTFDTRTVEPFVVKGKTEPVRAVVVRAPVGVRQSRRDDLPIVGREREIGVFDLIEGPIRGLESEMNAQLREALTEFIKELNERGFFRR